MKEPKFLVLGDAMTDYYHCGKAHRVSAECPIPVVEVEDTKEFPGGAANVAANLEALGASVLLVSGAGKIEKHRLMVGDYQVARWDVNDRLEPVKARQAADLAQEVDAVVVADYCKGSIDIATVKALLKIRLPLFVDTKRDPIWFGVYPVLFPNKAEYARFQKAYNICRNEQSVVLKKGADGLENGGRALPAWGRFVRSVNGCGDSVIAAYAYASVRNYRDPLAFANAAAAVVVEKPYTAVATKAEVLERLAQHEQPLAA